MPSQLIFDTQNADGQSGEFVFKGVTYTSAERGRPSRVMDTANLYVTGDMQGTITVLAKAPNGDFVPVSGSDITTTGMFPMVAAPFVGKLDLSGYGAGAGVTVYLDDEALSEER